ncbi:protocadherin gamma-C4-like [Latimeria chalumnae]|uniref:protocadherin gamma-C4-like n=1 Tax=Latimeria chalumnae TaxID=7897 RepID=UPI00313DFC09
METETKARSTATNIHWTYACLIVSVIWNIVSGQIRYSVSEEVGQGTFIGNIAKDLGLNIKQLSNRKFQIASTVRNDYIDANLQNGKLLIKEKMDRENLCGQKTVCFLNIEFVMENPFEIHYAEIEILDVNDNSPIFPKESTLFSVAESSQVGTRIPLESAEDSDVGMNSVAGYELSRNDNFVLDIENRGEGSKIPYLVLEKPLDREKQPVYHLLLTATDGGEPQRSGTLQITVTVLDSNDNAPRFDQKVYSVSLLENSSEGTLVIKINATDADEGSNGVVNYFFGSRTTEKVKNIFALDHKTGEIIVKELTDFEEETYFEIEVQARDGGQPELISHCTVVVKIIDVNDNSPVISISSSLGIIKEDAKPGSMVALISIRDPDSGENGQVHCQVSENMPFKLIPSLKANLYSLVSGDSFDREVNSEYNITITAIDSGSPPLSSSTTIYVQISDINDNPPRFGQSSYTVYVMENNVPGASIFSVDAIDPDWKENAMVTYSILENKFKGNSESPFVSVNSDNGNIFALDSFDFERVKHFSFQVQAQDSGTPSLSSTTTINVFVLDQNDNAPKILSPVPKMGSKLATETVSKFVNSGHLVTKLRAYDADIGYNAWLCFQLLQSTDPTLFTIGIYTGEVRTRRPFVDRDASTQELVLLVKDNGDPQLSATLTMAISLLSSLEDGVPLKDYGFKDTFLRADYTSNTTLYLIITLGSISFLFLVSIIILIASQLRKSNHESVSHPWTPYSHRGEVNENGSEYLSYRYKMRLSQESSGDLILVKPLTPIKSTNIGDCKSLFDEKATNAGENENTFPSLVNIIRFEIMTLHSNLRDDFHHLDDTNPLILWDNFSIASDA